MITIISNLAQKCANYISFISSRLKDREDSEHEQAIVRVTIILSFTIYILVASLTNQEKEIDQVLLAFTSLTVLFSLGILLAIIVRPEKSVFRRIFSLIADIGMLSLCLAIFGENGAPWWPVYLWVILGFGFRYGENYLYLASGFGFICFGVILLTVEYWQAHTALGIGLLISLLALPGYVSTLLKKLTETMRRLTEAQQTAEDANKAKSEFLARMSHEIRTPLNGIIGSSELLQSCNLGREQKEYADTIYASGHNLLHLIEDILDISKIEAGKLTLEKTDFDLHNLLHTTVKMLTKQAEVKGLNLSCHIGVDTPYKLIGDPFHFRQILNNLVGNAIKFTEKGSVEIHCHVKRSDDTKVLIRFEVVDTGIGIPEEVQERIFDKFSQADESTTRRFGGTGLGTAITKQLVELMGGRIGIQSTPNIGSTFWFDIEFELQDQASGELDIAALQDCKVLRLIQDSDITTSIASALHGWDVQYQNVNNTRDTIRLLMDAAAHNAPYEVLIIDGMPLNGDISAFVQSIGKELSLPSITILVIQKSNQPVPAIDAGTNQLYTFTEPLDKALLFNALHASHASHFEGDDIISLADHFISEHQAQHKYRILVAEDNSVNRMVIGRILERKGHSHRLVENGQDLLDALEEEEFDLVISDMQMPIVSGIEAYKMYRFAHASEEPIPFIMLTANATLEARRECREVGIKHFLTKPISSQKLLDSISHATAHLSDTEHDGVNHKSGTTASARNIDSPIIDYKIFDDVVELSQGKDFLQRLYKNLQRDCQQLLQGMEESVKCHDFIHFKELAHALKGSAAHLGLKELTRLSSSAQHMSDPEIKARGNAHIIEIRHAYERAMTAISEEIGLQEPSSH